jgi:signal transduction histidine kinase
MMRFSSRIVIILAAVCFAGLVIIQIAWMRSAYEGEVALYRKAKTQFEAELQARLSQNNEVKARFKEILDNYSQGQQLTTSQTDWFHFNLVPLIDLAPEKSDLGIFIDGISIVRYRRKDSLGITTIVSNIFETPDSSQIKNAGKLCIDCIVGNQNDSHVLYAYQLLLFYRHQEIVVYKKLDFLILCSLSLLIILGLLFRQIMRKYKQEKKLSEAKNDFINNLSHEMQTPVFAIQMANKLVIEKMPEGSEIKPLTQIIEKEAKQLKLHAGKILELASLENGQIELNKEVIEVNNFIEEKQHTIELLMKEKGGKLTLKFYTKRLYSELDPVHFNNVLISIADNAIKYNESSPQLVIETGESDNMLYLKFIDNGIGIRKEYLARITDKFFRVPDIRNRRAPGFGLGLNYVKHIVDLHKGEIRFASEEGNGTTVTILLPKATADV